MHQKKTLPGTNALAYFAQKRGFVILTPELIFLSLEMFFPHPEKKKKL
jgi:hypothetical protein